MDTRFGHVTFTKLEIRHATLRKFCSDFDIEIIKRDKHSSIRSDDINCMLDDNFVYFLLENKTFIKIYDLDYYSNKTVEIISNKISRKEVEIENYLQIRKFNISQRYPYRYLSSYKIDYDLGGNYAFLKYDGKHQYEGNFEYRRSSL